MHQDNLWLCGSAPPHSSTIRSVLCSLCRFAYGWCPSLLSSCSLITTQIVSAEALRMVFLLKNTEIVEGGAYVDPIPDAWELEFIEVGQVRDTCSRTQPIFLLQACCRTPAAVTRKK